MLGPDSTTLHSFSHPQRLHPYQTVVSSKTTMNLIQKPGSSLEVFEYLSK